MSYRLGVDVGGTFTDLLVIDERSGRTWRDKVPSTPDDPSRAVISGAKQVCGTADILPADIALFLHGTTVATNAILEQKIARVGLVVTEGYRHVLQIARSLVPGGLAAWIVWPKPEPMAPLEATIEVSERVDADGSISRALDEAGARAALEKLKSQAPEAITICLMNSYVNDAHERRVSEIAAEVFPDLPISISANILPEMQEYERTLTTVANSAVRPTVSRYVANLERELAAWGCDAKLSLLRSDGGLTSAAKAGEAPVNLLMSGPAGGVAGAVWVAKNAGFENVLTLDMGGTSTDVALIEHGRPRLRRETSVGDLSVRASSLDVKTVGAGGGSIAQVPELTGALRVGPESAGAEPGPASYGKGGTQPTVTDANVVLGYLPEDLLGGTFKLDREAARTAVATIAEPLGLSVEDAAAGIIAIVNENMFGALRLVSVQQGYDPRDFALMPFGGAGPLHGNAMGKLMGSWPVLVPPSPGVLCAYGDATTRLRVDAQRSFNRLVPETSDNDVAAVMTEIAAEVRAELEAEGVPAADQEVSYELDMRYAGQAFEVPLPFSEGDRIADAVAAFDKEHKRLFTFNLTQTPHEIVNIRIVALGKAANVAAETIDAGDEDASSARVKDHKVYVDGSWHDAAIYDRAPAHVRQCHHRPCRRDGDGFDDADPTGPSCRGRYAWKPAHSPDGRRGSPLMPADIIQTNDTPFEKVDLDPVTLDIIENALRNARIEMDATLVRTAMSPGIREQGDAFPLIADPDGKMIVGQFGSFIDGFLKGFDETIEEGDMILLSDPYSCDGAVSHSNDWLVLLPVYKDGRLIAWTAMFGHQSDIGGKVAGSMPIDARSIFEEGVRIPPVKIYAKGVYNEDVIKLVMHQTRKPDWCAADLNALIAACRSLPPAVSRKWRLRFATRSTMSLSPRRKTFWRAIIAR